MVGFLIHNGMRMGGPTRITGFIQQFKMDVEAEKQ
jgi:hypothetical protein